MDSRCHFSVRALFLSALALLFISVIAHAQIAVVDVRRVMEETSEGRALTAEVRSYVQELSASLREREEALRQEENALGKRRGTIDEAEWNELRTGLETRILAFRQDKEDARTAVIEYTNERMRRFSNLLSPALEKMCLERGLLLVINASADEMSSGRSRVLYYDSAVDLTDELIRVMTKPGEGE